MGTYFYFGAGPSETTDDENEKEMMRKIINARSICT
jgi:hypothetical protein